MNIVHPLSPLLYGAFLATASGTLPQSTSEAPFATSSVTAQAAEHGRTVVGKSGEPLGFVFGADATTITVASDDNRIRLPIGSFREVGSNLQVDISREELSRIGTCNYEGC